MLVRGYQIAGSRPSRRVTRCRSTFGKIEIEYKEQKADGSFGGSTKVGWDVTKSTKL